MKIIEAQAAVLSNFEVYQHVAHQKDLYKKTKRRGPPNMETVARELLQYLRTAPSPLSQTPLTYTPSCIKTLIQRLQPFELSKGEVVMILNLRPASVAALNTVLEDMGDRYTETEQEDLVTITSEVLGQFDEPEEAPDADTSMQDTAETTS
ncbi:RNA polymerase III, subunit C17 [Cordyceps militaris CM01]|uniref:DNA-directed RNA polymerase III subunit RPC9 n=1 Tax=Cordyceps militaris (strain CM01) TaxID=983644 RepID=G3JA60_CORMM|nr:RNA polymerase III, subunit C17 [Cordyceps militaris CM01]EGX94230.1 RNA polymerase III, subunit C17 [Cordyceps militaris CM01]